MGRGKIDLSAAIIAENELGIRGTAKINSQNRGVVRRWLTAHGAPSHIVRNLSIKKLKALYNDTSIDNADAICAKVAELSGEDVPKPKPKAEAEKQRRRPTWYEVEKDVGQTWETESGERWTIDKWDEHDPDLPWRAAKASTFNTCWVDFDGLAENGTFSLRYLTHNPDDSEAWIYEEPEQPPEQPKEKPMGSQQRLNLDEAAQDFARSFSQMLAGAGVNEEVVRQIVKEAVDELAPRQLEIKANGKTKKIEGQTHAAFEQVLRVASTQVGDRRLIPWLAGPAGSGKTTIAEQVADALDLPFYCESRVASEYKLTGFIDANGNYVTTSFRKAFETGGVFLLDEVDASVPGVLTAFNAALANGKFNFPDGMVERHDNFVAIAAANTWGTGATPEYVGRNRIDAATLDRFIMIHINYDESLELALCGNEAWGKWVQAHRKGAAEIGLRHILSPRASIDGAALIAADMGLDEVENMTIYKGLDDASREKLISHAKKHAKRPSVQPAQKAAA